VLLDQVVGVDRIGQLDRSRPGPLELLTDERPQAFG
jgi:hypothetical protein